MAASIVVFTALDGALLAPRSSSFDDARTGLAELKRRKAPIVLVTSRTRGECLHFQRLMDLKEPFVFEGGAGVCLPKDGFPSLPKKPVAIERGGHWILPLAAPLEEVRAAYARIKESTDGATRAFSEMTVEEIAQEAGLPAEIARLAKERDFEEVFCFVKKEEAHGSYLHRFAKEKKLRVDKRGRWYHLHGDSDAVKAIDLLRKLYEQSLGGVRTIGIGSTDADLPILLEADVPVALLKPDGTHDAVLTTQVGGVRRVPESGPKGWSAGVFDALRG